MREAGIFVRLAWSLVLLSWIIPYGTTLMAIKIYLLLNGLLYLLFGLWCALDPNWTAHAVGFSLPAAQGIAEFVAVYGGLEFGVGVFFLLCAFDARFRLAGVLFGVCFYTGIFVFRTFAISQVGFDLGAGRNFYASEFLLMTWSWVLVTACYSTTRRNPTPAITDR